MLTSDSITVEECYQLGMVSKVFPADDLAERTLEFARRIAKIPTMAALLIKESVNQTQDNMGFYNALNACFTMHELNHAHWAIVHDDKAAVAKLGEDVPDWRGTKLKLSEKDTVEAAEAPA
jgi:enoyl-CoA hydratase